MIFVALYAFVGVIVAMILFARRDRPREKEIGSFILLLSDPLWLWLPVLLWPLWVVLNCLPQSWFTFEKPGDPGLESLSATENLIGRSGTALTPLMPTGRIVVDGFHRDARVEIGSIEKGALVTVVATSIGGELIAKEISKRGVGGS